jgi:glycosyltransferase involved in cell wall biosynthesis
MRKLIFATQKLDSRDPILAATVAKVRALAVRVDEVVVLCDSAEPGIAPANVRVHEFGASTQIQRGARFARALAGELRPRPDAFLAHMIPLYVILAAPLLKPLRVPIGLWYSHPKGHVLVRAADAAATVVFSVDRTTFPLESHKLVPIGHGIDIAEFACADARGAPSNGLQALVLGRYSPIKGLDTILRAAALAAETGVRISVEAHGATGSELNEAHKLELEELALTLEVDAVLAEAVPRSAVPALFARADVLINATDGASADKVVYEAAASCLPVLAASPAFADLLPGELRFDAHRPETLVERLVSLDRRRRPELREIVEARHSVEHWADAVVATVGRR